MKTCTKCKTEKSLDQFYKRADRDANKYDVTGSSVGQLN